MKMMVSDDVRYSVWTGIKQELTILVVILRLLLEELLAGVDELVHDV
jgi:hypothetical protein